MRKPRALQDKPAPKVHYDDLIALECLTGRGNDPILRTADWKLVTCPRCLALKNGGAQ